MRSSVGVDFNRDGHGSSGDRLSLGGFWGRNRRRGTRSTRRRRRWSLIDEIDLQGICRELRGTGGLRPVAGSNPWRNLALRDGFGCRCIDIRIEVGDASCQLIFYATDAVGFLDLARSWHIPLIFPLEGERHEREDPVLFGLVIHTPGTRILDSIRRFEMFANLRSKVDQKERHSEQGPELHYSWV